MPWPGSPIMWAIAPLNSTSEEALDLFPHLSLSRWICSRLREPSGSQPATTKHDTPSFGLRKSEEHVRVRDGEEPLVADERPCAVAVGHGARLSLAQVRATLLLGHRHSNRAARLVGGADLATVIAVGGDELTPFAANAPDHRRRTGMAE